MTWLHNDSGTYVIDTDWPEPSNTYFRPGGISGHVPDRPISNNTKLWQTEYDNVVNIITHPDDENRTLRVGGYILVGIGMILIALMIADMVIK